MEVSQKAISEALNSRVRFFTFCGWGSLCSCWPTFPTVVAEFLDKLEINNSRYGIWQIRQKHMVVIAIDTLITLSLLNTDVYVLA